MALILPEASRLHLYYAPEATDDHPSYGFCKTDDGRCGYFHFDATGHYVWGRGDSPWLLYRLREILNPEIGTLYWCEGQKDADSLIKQGVSATDFQGLPLSDPELADLITSVATGKCNIVIPDNDSAGHKQAERFASFLYGLLQSEASIQRGDDNV